MVYDLVGITPTPINTDDILLIEPCLPPRNGDLILLCLGYPNDKRGIIARLFVDMTGKHSVQDTKQTPSPFQRGQRFVAW